MIKIIYIFLLFVGVIIKVPLLDNEKAYKELVFRNFFKNSDTENEFSKEIMEIHLINDSIVIPINEKLKCIDTLYFKITNKTDKTFAFIFNDSLFYFNNNKEDQYDTITTRPTEGINIRFYDINHFSLSTYAIEHYTPEEQSSDAYQKGPSLIIIKAYQTYIVKAVLKFPNHILFGEWEQKIINIERAKSAKIVFEPDIEQFQLYKNKVAKMVKGKFYPLKQKAEFNRPISFKCK